MRKILLAACTALAAASTVIAQDRFPDTTVVRPREIDSVLVNPHIGYTTFQRFNGDDLNTGDHWTEGYPIKYQEFDGDTRNKDYPQTSIAYFRVYWRFLEPGMDRYDWDLLDRALATASQRGQTLILRVAPYGWAKEEDVPDWYREMVGETGKLPEERWRVDPEDPRYVEHFTDMVRDLGNRYDGHPSLETVDISIVGWWGEGAGTDKLSDRTREALLDAYLEAFQKTNLVWVLRDIKSIDYLKSKRDIGWRVDCIGDLGFWAKEQGGWCHMYDYYPQALMELGMQDAWKKGPVTLEDCMTMLQWQKKGYDVDYVIDQTLKWHISSFNAKSSPVPKEWWPSVNRWLRKMGYRYVLRRFSYPDFVRPDSRLSFRAWWENKGVAPIYSQYTLALRLKSEKRSEVFRLGEDIRKWLPGDIVYNDAVFLPHDMAEGLYDLQLAILDPRTQEPAIKLAIEGRQPDGWYQLGKITVRLDK